VFTDLQADTSSASSKSSLTPNTVVNDSCKLTCLRHMLDSIVNSDERAVVVSTSARMLDAAKLVCGSFSPPLQTGRIDGSTGAQVRQELVNEFNSARSCTKVRL
jgi:SNF2 family DNA or RNA helicase